MTTCKITGCENEADRTITVNLSNRDVADFIGSYHEVVAIAPQEVAICGEHRELTVSGVAYTVADDAWSEDSTERTIKGIQLCEVSLGGEPASGVTVTP